MILRFAGNLSAQPLGARIDLPDQNKNKDTYVSTTSVYAHMQLAASFKKSWCTKVLRLELIVKEYLPNINNITFCNVPYSLDK